MLQQKHSFVRVTYSWALLLLILTPLFSSVQEPQQDIIGKWEWVSSSGSWTGLIGKNGWIEFFSNGTYRFNAGSVIGGSGLGDVKKI